MLESCPDLKACEERLQRQLLGLMLLGQIDLAIEDYEKLSHLIRSQVVHGFKRGMDRVWKQTPTAMVFFLVSAGTHEYQDGDYWSAVWDVLNQKPSPSRAAFLGRHFLDFLREHQLPTFQLSHSHRYVTPILLHGGIPTNCLPEYFEQVILPELGRGQVVAGAPQEIVEELKILREDERAREALEAQIATLGGQVRQLKKRLASLQRLCQARQEVLALWEIETEAAELGDLEDLPQLYSECRETYEDLAVEIQMLTTQRHACETTLTRFTKQDRAAIKIASTFRKWAGGYRELLQRVDKITSLEVEGRRLRAELQAEAAKIFSEEWQDEFSDRINQLNLEQLKKDIAEFQYAVEEIERLQGQLPREQADRGSPSSPRYLRQSLAVIGGLLVTAGILTSLTLALVPVGIVVLVIAGYVHFQGVKAASVREAESLRLTEALQRTEGVKQATRRRIADTLEDLPLRTELDSRLSPQLVTTFTNIVDLYRQLSEIRSLQSQLEQKVDQQLSILRDILEELSIEESEDVETMARNVATAIKQAGLRYRDAKKARAQLDQVILPQVHSLGQRQAATKEKMETIEHQLMTRGKGDIQSGLREIEALQQLKEDAVEQRRRLQVRYPDLQRIEDELKDSNEFWDKEVQRLEERLNQSRNEKKKLVAQRDRRPVPYQGIDEPIRKYLLYGGEVSERFLFRSATLLQHRQMERSIEDSEARFLPVRVLRAFDEWWSLYCERKQAAEDFDDGERVDGQRFWAPSIGLERSLTEITLQVRSQRCFASSSRDQLHLEILGGDPQQRQSISLPVYRDGDQFYSTETETYPLAFPAQAYTCRLRDRDGVLREWNLRAAREEAECFLFVTQSGRLVPEGPAPRTMVWVVSRHVEPADDELVRESGNLYGQWHEYRYWVVDLEEVDELRLADPDGVEVVLPVTVQAPVELGFVGGHPVTGVTSEDVPVYSGSPPCIRIPLKNELDLEQWRLAIYSTQNEFREILAYYRLSDVSEALETHVTEGWVDVDLTHPQLLDVNPIGAYQIALHNKPYVHWREKLCLVPQLTVAFEKAVYFPYEVDQPSQVSATVTVDKSASFTPHPSTTLSKVRTGQVRLKATTAKSTLRCGVGYRKTSAGAALFLPLSMRIPKIRWRFQGMDASNQNDWHDTLEDLWLGDYEKSNDIFLVVDVGGVEEGSVQLALPEHTSTSRVQSLREGRARFDFLPFRDELRTMGGLQTVALAIVDLNRDRVPLFRVRTRWEAVDIECVQRSEGDGVILDVSWTELGKSEDKSKIIRLWKVMSSAERPVVQQQVSGTSHQIRISRNKLAAGNYIIELVLEDPWSSTLPARPVSGASNTQRITIVAGADTLQDHVFHVRQVGEAHSRRKYPLKGTYTFRIVGRIVHHQLPESISDNSVLVTATNEGWYVAQVDVLKDPLYREEVRGANPVKIEYDARWNELRSVEDRTGDGAIYCCECRRLHWRQETIKFEESERHTLLGPVEKFYLT